MAHHGVLDRMQFAVRLEPFNGNNRPSMQHGNENKARIDGAPRRSTVGVVVQDGNRARATVTLSAAFFGAGLPLRATQPLQSGGGWAVVGDDDLFAVEIKCNRVHGHP